MNSIDLSRQIASLAFEAGAVAVGITAADNVDAHQQALYNSWLIQGNHAGMDYLERYPDIRRHPAGLLDGCKSVICVAFSYAQPVMRAPNLPFIAPYAYGKDYHKVIKKRLKPITTLLQQGSANSRICIDSAPLPERWWAVKSNIAGRCDNGMVEVPGYGQEVFLAEILTDVSLTPFSKIKGAKTSNGCTHCNKCKTACPTSALLADGLIDCNRCLNYLTIEHKGSFTDYETELLESAEKMLGHEVWVGCDACVRVCPLNSADTELSHYTLPDFLPSPQLLSLTPASYESLSDEKKEEVLAGSPLRRAFKNR